MAGLTIVDDNCDRNEIGVETRLTAPPVE